MKQFLEDSLAKNHLSKKPSLIFNIKCLCRKVNVRGKVAFSLLTLLSSLLSSAYAQQEDSAVTQLVEILNRSDSLQANVEQLVLDQSGRELEQSFAKLKIQKPDHFSWQLTQPYEELTVTNGENVWRYEPDLDQVTIQTFENDVNRTPLLLLNGNVESLQESYDISVSELPDASLRFTLLPLSPSALFERLSLTFTDSVLQEMQFEASVGQKTSLYFSALESNVSFSTSVFEFVIPEGIDVIDTTGD